jgi:leucyl-tRNA synthetase
MVARSYQKETGIYVPPEDVEEIDGDYYHKETKEKLRSQIDKMSKSKLNGITPDDVIEEFGSDSLRLYEMFLGPLDKEKVWNTEAVSGCRRFLNRFWDIAQKSTDIEPSEEALKLGHRLVKGVTEDIENLQFNTAIAKMMEFVNSFIKLDAYPKNVVKMATQVLAPFAPHVAQEIWENLGCQEDLNQLDYPEVDPKYLIDDVITYVVQVNGKLRGRFDLPKDQDKETIFEAAKKLPPLEKYLSQGEVKKIIFVPNKLINIVITNG